MEPSSATKTIGIVRGWGDTGLFVSLFDIVGTVKGSVGISLLTAIYNVLAEVLVVKIILYKALRKLVSTRNNAGGMVCCWLRWLL